MLLTARSSDRRRRHRFSVRAMPMFPSPSPSFRRTLAVSLLLAGLTGCASVNGAYVWADDVASDPAPSGYTVGAGDLIAVQVWDNAELSTRARVRGDGKVSIPLLNDIDVAGKQPEQIAREVEQKLTASSLVRDPHVTVMIEEARPVSVSVLGKVTRAGTYTLAPGGGVAEALAGAGGLTEFAHKDRIFVLRRTPAPMRIRFTFESLTDLTERAAVFPLRTGDVVVVE